MNLSIKISLHDPQGSVEVLASAFHSIISGGWFYMGSASDLEKKKIKENKSLYISKYANIC